MNYIRISVGVFLLIQPFTQVFASPTPLAISSILSADSKTTTLETTLGQDYITVKNFLNLSIGKFLEAIPGVSQASNLREAATPVIFSSSDLVKRAGNRNLLIRFVPQIRISDSLFKVKEQNNECKNLSLAEADCPLNIILQLTGPVYTYQSHNDFGLPRPGLLNQSFMITFEAKPVDRAILSKGTLLTIKLEVLNSSYDGFFRQLHESGRLPRIPLQKELSGVFALSMQRAIREFAEMGGVK